MFILAAAFIFSGADFTNTNTSSNCSTQEVQDACVSINVLSGGAIQKPTREQLMSRYGASMKVSYCVDFAMDMADDEEWNAGSDFTLDDWFESYWFHLENCDPDMVIVEVSLP